MTVRDNSEEYREVLAEFALATFQAQSLERQLAVAITSADLLPKARVGSLTETYDAYLKARYRDTLGRLISRLSRVVTVPAHLDSLLLDALETRNWLAHHYFWERADDLVTASGRDRLLGELKEAQTLLSLASERLEHVMSPFLETLGINEDELS